MRLRAGAKLITRTAGALLCLAVSCLPAAAARNTLTTGDGSVFTVWEQRGRSTVGHGPAPWSIAYSIRDASGTRGGLVPPTQDMARDASPFLALDDNGSPVLVWSRFDGVWNKIAYARYADGSWTDFHFLTFGPNDDLLPLIATTSGGSYLFYTGLSDKYFFVPVDLDSGRLLAAPRQMDLGIWHRPSPRLFAPGTPSTQGGVDVPINNRGCKDGGCASGSTLTRQRAPGPSTLGGVDAPILNKNATWGSAAGGDCSNVVLIVPAGDGKSAIVVDFHNGVARGLLNLILPDQPDAGYGDSLAASYLVSLCD